MGMSFVVHLEECNAVFPPGFLWAVLILYAVAQVKRVIQSHLVVGEIEGLQVGHLANQVGQIVQLLDAVVAQV